MRTRPVWIILLAIVGMSAVEARQRGERSTLADDPAVRKVVDDYVGLYRKDTLPRWKELFVPGFTATFTNDDGSVTTRTLDDFYERQRAGFARGAMSETLHNVRVQRAGRIAQAFADFRFASGGSAPRPGQLMLLLIEDRGQFKIAAVAFTYHVQ